MMGNFGNVKLVMFIVLIQICFGQFDTCQQFPGIIKDDKMYLESATDQDLEHLDRCLLHEAFVLRMSVRHSNITLTSLVSALSEEVRESTTVIDINKCDMKKVPNGALTNIPHLLSIHFANNTISELEENAFQGLNEVTIIDLSYNFLTEIKARAFNSLDKLLELYLDGNELISLSPDAFMNIRTIDVLSMDNNDLQDIPYRAFRKSPIKYWHVANNRITEISSQIEKFPYLASLDIRNNNLRTTSKKLSRLHYLRELHISGNNLTTLPGALSNVLKRRNFNTHLGNNPWHCDCGIFWLITIVKEGFVKEELFCTTPQNISMDKVDTSGFDCKVDTGSVEMRGETVVPIILSSIVVVGGLVAVVTMYFLKNRTRRIKKPIMMIMNGQYYRPRTVVDSADMTVSTNTLEYTTFEVSDEQKQNTSDVGLTDTKLFGRLRLGKLIGRGAFGDVFEGMASDANSVWRKVAVKKIRDNATTEESDMLIRECQYLTDSGKHPNIIQVLGTGEINGSLIMVLEFADNGDLLAHLKSLERTNHKVIQNLDSSEWKAYLQNTHPRLFLYMWHIAKGMEYLARMKIIHRDLAGRNILLSSEHVAKISDFGLSRDVYENGYYYQNSNGRMPYKWMSPESLFSGKYTTKSDVWSFGILLWEIVTLGANPYPGIPPDMLQNMYKHNYVMPSPPLCPEYIYSIMEECWSFLPEKRPGFDSLLDTFDKLLQTVVNKEYMDVFKLDGKEDCVSNADDNIT